MKLIRTFITKAFVAMGALLFLGSLGTVQAAVEAKAKPAENFIQDLGARAIKSLTTGTQAQISKNFLALLDEGFDMDYIAKFVMGRYWKEFSDAQKAEFKVLFKKRLEHTYSVHFKEYKQAELKIKSSRPEKSFEVVETTIQKPGGPITPVQWKVSTATGSYKIRDVVVEGVSMSNTLRSDYSAAYQNAGSNPVGLLKTMKENP